MANRRIDGLQLEKMLRNALNHLKKHEEEINRLNVFPVADGDTGTNMRLTLEGGLKHASSHPEVGLYLNEFSRGTLLGARGNSGVILSQYFRGLAQEMARDSFAGPGELRNGLIRAYRTAYAAVARPVEGTILTVAREGIENCRSQIVRTTTVEQLLAMVLAEMRKSQARTPDVLPVLREAGVVDSGAEGLIRIVEGALKYLYGEVLEDDALPKAAPKETAVPAELFGENSRFEAGYCLEFTLQRLKDPRYLPVFRKERFAEDLSALGSSLVLVEDGTRIKVHIHTLRPGRIMTLAQEYGEFVDFKLDNLELQQAEEALRRPPKAKRVPLAAVAAADGAGIRREFLALGCRAVVEGGPTMNPSAEEFAQAAAGLNAETVVLLPDHKNNLLAAQQACALLPGRDVRVLPSRSVAEGYFALAMDMGAGGDTKTRLAQMEQGLSGVITLSGTTATRDYRGASVNCRRGDQLVLLDGEPAAAGDAFPALLRKLLPTLPELEDKETAVLFRGRDCSEEEAAGLTAVLEECCPMVEVQVLDGGQTLCPFILGIS